MNIIKRNQVTMIRKRKKNIVESHPQKVLLVLDHLHLIGIFAKKLNLVVEIFFFMNIYHLVISVIATKPKNGNH